MTISSHAKVPTYLCLLCDLFSLADHVAGVKTLRQVHVIVHFDLITNTPYFLSLRGTNMENAVPSPQMPTSKILHSGVPMHRSMTGHGMEGTRGLKGKVPSYRAKAESPEAETLQLVLLVACM